MAEGETMTIQSRLDELKENMGFGTLSRPHSQNLLLALEIAVKKIELLKNHHRQCDCWCMDYHGIGNEALAEIEKELS
jgi:hypothetical protein